MQSPPKPNKKESKYMFFLEITQALVISSKPHIKLLIFLLIGRAEITPIIVENRITNEQTDKIDFDALAVDSTKESVRLSATALFS